MDNFCLHQTYKRHKAATKDTHQNGSSLLTNGHAKAENHSHKKLRSDWPRGGRLRALDSAAQRCIYSLI